MRHSSDSWLKSPLSTTTLADAAADAAANKSRAISLGAADASQRPLNLDFIPRVGWTGTVFPSVASPVLCSIAVSVATLWAHETQGFSGIGTTGHTILGVLVSFLAVFRTQQAYARYWEGRGHLGLLMAGLVDVASIASVQFSGEKPELAAAARAELARLLRLYFRETVKFLRKTSRTTQRVSNYWLPADASFSTEQYAAMECDVDATESECEELASVPRPPILVLQWVRAHLYRAGVEGGLLAGSDASERTRTLELGVGPVLGRLQPEFNGCAKIATTPAPQPYTQMGVSSGALSPIRLLTFCCCCCCCSCPGLRSCFCFCCCFHVCSIPLLP